MLVSAVCQPSLLPFMTISGCPSSGYDAKVKSKFDITKEKMLNFTTNMTFFKEHRHSMAH